MGVHDPVEDATRRLRPRALRDGRRPPDGARVAVPRCRRARPRRRRHALGRGARGGLALVGALLPQGQGARGGRQGLRAARAPAGAREPRARSGRGQRASSGRSSRRRPCRGPSTRRPVPGNSSREIFPSLFLSRTANSGGRPCAVGGGGGAMPPAPGCIPSPGPTPSPGPLPARRGGACPASRGARSALTAAALTRPLAGHPLELVGRQEPSSPLRVEALERLVVALELLARDLAVLVLVEAVEAHHRLLAAAAGQHLHPRLELLGRDRRPVLVLVEAVEHLRRGPATRPSVTLPSPFLSCSLKRACSICGVIISPPGPLPPPGPVMSARVRTAVPRPPGSSRSKGVLPLYSSFETFPSPSTSHALRLRLNSSRRFARSPGPPPGGGSSLGFGSSSACSRRGGRLREGHDAVVVGVEEVEERLLALAVALALGDVLLPLTFPSWFAVVGVKKRPACGAGLPASAVAGGVRIVGRRGGREQRGRRDRDGGEREAEMRWELLHRPEAPGGREQQPNLHESLGSFLDDDPLDGRAAGRKSTSSVSGPRRSVRTPPTVGFSR